VNQSDPIRIEWASAVVEEGRLTVELDREPPDGWSDGFAVVLDRLRRPVGAWGEIELEDRRVRVADVTQGAEAELRHLLESAVLQANASAGLAAAEERAGDDDDDHDDPTPDQEMTERFRSFAD
jgi:hypothetical protein